MLRFIRKFSVDARGNVGLLFAIGAPMVFAGAYIAIELAQVTSSQAKLQAIADSAAIAAARELRLGNATKTIVIAVARSVVDAQSRSIGSPVEFAGDVPSDKK